MRRRMIILIVIVLLVAGLTGYYLGRTGVEKVNRMYQAELKQNQALRQELQYQKVALFYMKSTDTDIFLHPVTRKIKTGPDLYQSIVTALLEGPPEASGLLPLFPKGSKVLSVKVNGGLAVVNLNQRAAALNLGSSGETLAVGSIVNTLTKLPDIFRVRIVIEGNEVESLAGHVDLTQTFTYNQRLLAPEYR